MTSKELSNWTRATGSAKWGVQQAIKTSLELVAEGEIRMCWGADVHEGAPCLINSINQMLSHNADKSPSGDYPEIVMAFDALNAKISSHGFVDPLAAEIMLRYMGPFKPMPVSEAEEDPTPALQDLVTEQRENHGTPEGAVPVEEVTYVFVEED